MARWRHVAAGLATSLSVLALAACGGGHSPTNTHPVSASAAPSTFQCVQNHAPGFPSQAGECIKQELRAEHFALTPPAEASAAPQCVDISNFQGIPNFGVAKRVFGIRCVIIQTNDGGFHNPFFWMQAVAARNNGLPWGTYTFLEGSSGAGQVLISHGIASTVGRPPLGMWGDAEIDAAYAQACPYVREARALGERIYGMYGSPGTYRGGRCPGYDWVARWSSGPAGALPGYPVSATIFRQWCGTCRMAGAFAGEIDRDESLGLLGLVQPPESLAAHRAKLRRELAGHLFVLHKILEPQRERVRRDLHAKRCDVRRHRHQKLGPVCRRTFKHGDRISAHGRYEDRVIKHLKAQLR